MRPPIADDLELIGRFLARRDLPSLETTDRSFDVLVLCGNAVLAAVEVTARAFHRGLVRQVLVSGGIGHSTPYLVGAVRTHPRYADVAAEGRPEAAVLADVLERHWDVPRRAIATETASTNCGENAAFSLAALQPTGARSVLLVQDPTMQRRTHAGFDHSQHAVPDRSAVLVTSYAPILPVVHADGVRGQEGGQDGGRGGTVAWSLDRFTSLVLGEVRRLHDDEDGYGPRGAGFIGHVDVPDEVLQAGDRLRSTADRRLRR